LSPLDRLRLFTTPHVTRLMDILRQFSPGEIDTFVYTQNKVLMRVCYII
jgi:hypothetical protein